MKIIERLYSSEKGSITVFALSISLFILVSLIIIYMSISNKITSQNRDVNTIMNEYNVTNDEMEAEYDKVNKN